MSALCIIITQFNRAVSFSSDTEELEILLSYESRSDRCILLIVSHAHASNTCRFEQSFGFLYG